LSVLCRTLDQLRGVLDWTLPAGCPALELVYCDFEEVRLSKTAVVECRTARMRVALATPRVVKPREEGLLLQIARCGPDAVLVRNLAAVSFYQERFPELPLYGDYALNVVNDLTADLFARRGLVRLTPGYDLNLGQLEALLARFDPGCFEVVLHQHMPMFHMEHCVFSHVLSNGKDFHDCARPCDRHVVELRDHVGQAHPLIADVGCRNTVFHARAQSAAAYVPRLVEQGVRHFRVELLREDAPAAQSLLTAYARGIAGLAQPADITTELRVLSGVGITCGTLEFE
jgi:putative protease